MTRSTRCPLAAERSSMRHAIALRMISVGGYHLKGSATISARWPASISASRKPSTCDSAPPRVKGTCVVQMRIFMTAVVGGQWINLFADSGVLLITNTDYRSLTTDHFQVAHCN